MEGLKVPVETSPNTSAAEPKTCEQPQTTKERNEHNLNIWARQQLCNKGQFQKIDRLRFGDGVAGKIADGNGQNRQRKSIGNNTGGTWGVAEVSGTVSSEL